MSSIVDEGRVVVRYVRGGECYIDNDGTFFLFLAARHAVGLGQTCSFDDGVAASHVPVL